MRIKKVLEHYKYKRWTIFALSLVILLMMFLFENAAFALRTMTAIIFIIFFYIVDNFFDIRFKAIHYFLIAIISITSLLLSPLYFVYPNYDKILHLILPMLVFSIIFYMVSQLKIELKWQLTFSLFITLGILGIFEIGEFLLDRVSDLRLQGVYIRDVKGLEKLNLISDPHYDTMTDMSFGVVGSLIYGIILGLFNWRKLRDGEKKKK